MKHNAILIKSTQEKITYYERDYLKISRIKEIEEREYYMQRELNIRDENIESLTELLQESEEKVSSLEEIIEQVKEENSSERHKILTTLTNEREEITARNDHLKVLKSLKVENEKTIQ